MLERIPSISPKGLNAYFCSIDSMLSSYDGSTMLELAIWKLKIEEQTDGNINLLTPDMKMECRNISIEMVGVIFPIVLPFLRGNANEGDDGDNDDGDDDEDDEEMNTVTLMMTTVQKLMEMMTLMKAMMVTTITETMTKMMKMMNTVMTMTMTLMMMTDEDDGDD